jgi:hypothetical protein
MLKLSDEELTQVFRAAGPLQPGDRNRFLESVASKLAGATIGPGSVYKACVEAQRELMNGSYPALGSGSWAKYR